MAYLNLLLIIFIVRFYFKLNNFFYIQLIYFLLGKACVALCIDNMQRVPQLTPLEIVEMFVATFCFLKDSSEVSHVLLDDFRTCQGYSFLSEFLLK